MKKGPIKILIADDDEMVRMTVSSILQLYGYQVETVTDGSGVLQLVDDSYDVIILDINMPGKDGFQTMEELNSLKLEIPILFLTGAGSIDYAIRAINLGAYDFLTKPIEGIDIFNAKITRAVEKRMYIRKEREYQRALEDDIRIKANQLKIQNDLLLTYNKSLENATVQLMTSLQNAMEEKDYYTAGHTVRVTEYAIMVGRAMGLSEDELLVLSRAAQFHDIGKLVIDLSCIRKSGSLSDEEWQLIRKHPTIGENIVQPLGFMKREQFIIRHHHERVDGKGYPDGLTGDKLDPLTKIIMVVDSYDAMTSKRNYRKNMSMEQAIKELHDNVGSQFDGDTVNCFCKKITDFVPTGNVFSREYLETPYNNGNN